jgi:orotidine-5'-phosphate decarboxylase
MMERERLIVALDHPSATLAWEQVGQLGDVVTRYKVGLELYLAAGRALIERLNSSGKKVFVDLKLHDIPETVKRAASIVGGLGADLLTVHASGGRAMLQAAAEGAGAQTRVLAVTVLTSLDAKDLAADGNPLSVEDLVVRRALLAREAGCAGVIASPHEAAAIRAALPSPFLIITPGVRFAAADDDQKRVATPQAARKAGADAVVVGRPIRDAADRRAAAERFLRELA